MKYQTIGVPTQNEYQRSELIKRYADLIDSLGGPKAAAKGLGDLFCGNAVSTNKENEENGYLPNDLQGQVCPLSPMELGNLISILLEAAAASKPGELQNWQLFKRDLKTNEVVQAFSTWSPMTRGQAINAEKAYDGTYQPNFHFFAAPIAEFKEKS